MGTCLHSSSTVSALVSGSKTPKDLAVSEVIPGHRILSAGVGDHKMAFSKVLAVYKSPATAPYLDIKVDSKKNDQGRVLRATEFHTLASCDGQHVPANQLKLGDCLRTAHGPSAIVSITPTPATKDDMTYTILVEGETDLIYVGGILTHAKPEHMVFNSKAKVAKKLKHKKGLRGPVRGGIHHG